MVCIGKSGCFRSCLFFFFASYLRNSKSGGKRLRVTSHALSFDQDERYESCSQDEYAPWSADRTCLFRIAGADETLQAICNPGFLLARDQSLTAPYFKSNHVCWVRECATPWVSTGLNLLSRLLALRPRLCSATRTSTVLSAMRARHSKLRYARCR